MLKLDNLHEKARSVLQDAPGLRPFLSGKMFEIDQSGFFAAKKCGKISEQGKTREKHGEKVENKEKREVLTKNKLIEY